MAVWLLATVSAASLVVPAFEIYPDTAAGLLRRRAAAAGA